MERLDGIPIRAWLRWRLHGECTAFLSAMQAGFAAFLRQFIRVLQAMFAANFANLGADLGKRFGKPAMASHAFCGKRTDVGAIPKHRDLHVPLARLSPLPDHGCREFAGGFAMLQGL